MEPETPAKYLTRLNIYILEALYVFYKKATAFVVELQSKFNPSHFALQPEGLVLQGGMRGMGEGKNDVRQRPGTSRDLTSLHPRPLAPLWLASYRFLFHISLPPPL